LSAEQSRSLTERMLGDIARMENMVTQILDSMRLSSGHVQLKQEGVDLAAAAARVIGQFAERAQSEGVSLTADVPSGLQILADPLALDAVMRNLIENAFAAVAPGGGGSIALTARRLNDEVEVVVRDSGVGFNPSDRARLFRKFSRLHPGGGSTYYGTGLGLFIVRRLMQLAGGRVTAHSAGLGQGASFVLAWPIFPSPVAREARGGSIP
jgi:signal transduction histidine kinase